MTHEIVDDNTYLLFDDEGEVVLSITITNKPGNQIVLRTKKSVFQGPIEFLEVE